MSDSILRRLAKRFWRCPFDQELFDSNAALSQHLIESHLGDICQRSRIPKQDGYGDIDRPSKLWFCGHCLGNMVPEALGRYPSSEIPKHISEMHPNPFGSAFITMKPTTDPVLIDQFMYEQASSEVFECRDPGCGHLLSSESAIADHWIDKHCLYATIEDVRTLLEIAPERCDAALDECLAAQYEEDRRRNRASEEPDDGYPINRWPDVPRVRSRPSEVIVYVERERARLHEEEFQEMCAASGYDDHSDMTSDEPWTPQTIRLELRFCNIQGGFIPTVQEVRRILPDVPEIEASWQDSPADFFPCKVSRSKRAIYNSEGRLQETFDGLPAGVVLYMKRVGHTRYELRLNPKPHTVRNCKVFIPVGEREWKVDFQDLEEKWETGEAVFRHQSTFEQMDALYEEAKRTKLSVRDAVYQVMQRLPKGEYIKIKEVYDVVCCRMRTCSPAAVWSQFRKEHTCYERVGPGLYRFNAAIPLPRVRDIYTNSSEANEHQTEASWEGRAGNSRLKIKVKWSEILKKSREDELFSEGVAAKTQALFVAALIREFGNSMVTRLSHIRVSGGHPLSDAPQEDFRYGNGRVFNHTQIPETSLYLYTNTDNRRKKEDILRLAAELGFPLGSVEVEIVYRPNLRDFLATI